LGIGSVLLKNEACASKMFTSALITSALIKSALITVETIFANQCGATDGVKFSNPPELGFKAKQEKSFNYFRNVSPQQHLLLKQLR